MSLAAASAVADVSLLGVLATALAPRRHVHMLCVPWVEEGMVYIYVCMRISTP